MTTERYFGSDSRAWRVRGALRRLIVLLLRVARTRADAVVDRFRAEAHRLIALTALTLLAVFFLMGGVSFAVLGIVLALWETQRVLAFAVVALIFGLLASISLLLVRRNLHSVRSPQRSNLR